MDSLVKKYSLEIAVFLCGAAVMVLELVASRFFAPQFGTSLYVWASIIGVILGSLSAGYWLGGRLSTVNPSAKKLAAVILGSAIFIFIFYLAKDFVFSLAAAIRDIRFGSLVSALVFFALPNILLGIVSPYAARLRIMEVENSGQTVGNLYAISTVGSIAGTFLAGFWLIGAFGSEQIILFLTLVLIAASLVVDRQSLLKLQIIALAAILVLLAIQSIEASEEQAVNVETPYGHYFIKDSAVGPGVTMRSLHGSYLDAESQMLIVDGEPSDELASLYSRYFLLAEHFHPGFRNVLVVGGGAYSFPKYFLSRYPEAGIDVVEIDEKLTEASKKYFNLRENPRMAIIHEDGRIYLNNNKKIYDCVYMDAFNATYAIPYHLTTRETIQKIYDSLDDDGIAAMNIISGLNGEKGKFLRAEYRTYKSVFPQVYLFSTSPGDGREKPINYVLIATKSKERPVFSSANPEIDGYLQDLVTEEIGGDMPILTDDFAPTDQYVAQMLVE